MTTRAQREESFMADYFGSFKASSQQGPRLAMELLMTPIENTGAESEENDEN